ncbi:hypothetical protein DFJ74DRAFT_249495 [Hyaloraphidium curvatum]|nr:hypothetical protein DFJ74DRAFT_249495 [Hyaloraphidium curvatum]
MTLVIITAVFFESWTPVVRCGQQTWTHPWSAVLASVMLFTLLFHYCTFSPVHNSIVLLRLARRVHHRAALLATSSLLQRYREATNHPRAALELCEREAVSEKEAYVVLHSELVRFWASQPFFAPFLNTLSIEVVSEVVTLVIFVSTGNCIPICLVLLFVFYAVAYSFHLADLAVRNGMISAVTDVYRSARREIHELLVDSATLARNAGRVQLEHALLMHSELLASFCEADRMQGKILGIRVDQSTPRRALATLITLCVGLWTILRSSGTFLTTDNVCPGGT